MMIDTTKFYNSIIVCIALTSIQGHKLEVLQSLCYKVHTHKVAETSAMVGSVREMTTKTYINVENVDRSNICPSCFVRCAVTITSHKMRVFLLQRLCYKNVHSFSFKGGTPLKQKELF